MDGVTFLREALRRYPDTAFVMLTGVAEVTTAFECLKLGALDYISKPVLVEEVRARVDKALEKRDLVLQNRFYQQHLESRVKELDRRNKQSLINGVQTLVHALEAKDSYTSGHSTRVSRYAVKTAVQLGYTGERMPHLGIFVHFEAVDAGRGGRRERHAPKVTGSRPPLQPRRPRHYASPTLTRSGAR
jgi:response regulator RpfG family c-di-GMP phosphodiesterase